MEQLKMAKVCALQTWGELTIDALSLSKQIKNTLNSTEVPAGSIISTEATQKIIDL